MSENIGPVIYFGLLFEQVPPCNGSWFWNINSSFACIAIDHIHLTL
ncbi:MAG: hypothetical protein IPI00_02530 [Flavobacteriales bacterium]|nr:hypothetical protein [Flavobacteriales bacterium]MBK6946006.1 hypothetical protein [Flavobacteriales bacterium]MBK7239056.1 hypothetical protein [Flavobacteriales bacterium]MBK7296760.1 hypothetical protein [Flavobacteriales bacterium]MBK9536839.1 hypothetical protein [Flavobacteriales bacterium]